MTPESTPTIRSPREMLAAHPSLARAAALYALAEGGQQAFTKARNWWKSHRTLTVSVRESDGIYDDVHAWVLRLMPDGSDRGVEVRSGRRRFSDYVEVAVPDDDSDRPSPGLTIVLDDDKSRTVRIDGQRVEISIRKPEYGTNISSNARLEHAIIFTCYTRVARDGVIDHLEALSRERTRTVPVLRMVNTWGGWNRRADLPLRRPESVILADGQVERVIDDLRGFLDAEEQYNRLGIPWHRGYLLHGPPGTGKTSLVKAMATALGLDLWYVPLGDLTREASLMNLVSEVGPRSMLLLEDVDTYEAATERQSEGNKIKMSTLLNMLDGVATPHGLVTVMTTNYLERLDPAVTRAGRMDMVEEIALPGVAEVIRMFDYFYGEGAFLRMRGRDDLHTVISRYRPTQAQVAEVFKAHMDDPQTGAEALFGIGSREDEEAVR